MQLFEEEKSAPAWYMCQSYVPKYVLKWSPASEPDCRLTKLFWRARLTIWLGNSANIGNGNIWRAGLTTFGLVGGQIRFWATYCQWQHLV